MQVNIKLDNEPEVVYDVDQKIAFAVKGILHACQRYVIDSLPKVDSVHDSENEVKIQCNQCKYYEGVHGTPGHAPCSYHGFASVMYNDLCLKFKQFDKVETKDKLEEWIPVKSVSGIVKGQFECSKCGRTIFLDEEETLEDDYPYCHCGAKMVES